MNGCEGIASPILVFARLATVFLLGVNAANLWRAWHDLKEAEKTLAQIKSLRALLEKRP